MTKEYEIGLNLIKTVRKELEELTSVQDRLSARRIVNAIINPITASAYQIRVGDGPNKEEILKVLLALVKEMRELSDLDNLKEKVKSLIEFVESVEKETAKHGQG